IILFSTITIVLTVILFCYICILKKIKLQTPIFSTSSSGSQGSRRSNRSNQSNRNENGTNEVGISLEQYHSEVERKAIKKILSYIAIFILQWIPMSVSQGARLVLVKYFINLMK